MLFSVLSELTWQFYNEGRAKATSQNFKQQDVWQHLKTSIAEVCRLLYYSSKRNKDGVPFYFVSPMLSIQKLKLSDANLIGKRTADMSEFDMYRLPHDVQVTALYPIGCNDKGDFKSIPLVDPGEEYFYAGNSKFKGYRFGVLKGKGIDTYNLPPCVTALDAEATFHSDTIDPDVSTDVAYEASNLTLGKMLGMPEFSNKGVDNSLSPLQRNLRQRISNQQPEVQTP